MLPQSEILRTDPTCPSTSPRTHGASSFKGLAEDSQVLTHTTSPCPTFNVHLPRADLPHPFPQAQAIDPSSIIDLSAFDRGHRTPLATLRPCIMSTIHDGRRTSSNVLPHRHPRITTKETPPVPP
ncbi:hypothetical protein EW146_g9266 [Bondarzewia mesenterica]|uniref:Uncharacterized protein n=1 Tax=Bondarzewia mesenterica TaxID=1095465 RepID=A0A4S4L9P3_9AGAM|nr:hypothetical protein EW146_g9266 [Bondarzewia mesenterica]